VCDTSPNIPLSKTRFLIKSINQSVSGSVNRCSKVNGRRDVVLFWNIRPSVVHSSGVWKPIHAPGPFELRRISY